MLVFTNAGWVIHARRGWILGLDTVLSVEQFSPVLDQKTRPTSTFHKRDKRAFSLLTIKTYGAGEYNQACQHRIAQF